MAFDISVAKRLIQDHLQEGLLLVVGTGLSMAEGIPGMWPLAEHLKKVIPQKLVSMPDPGWATVVLALDAGEHLEAAMGKATLNAVTVDAIVEATAELIRENELVVIREVMAGTRTLPFTEFARHLFKAAKKFHLITPNYDRLIEIATEAAGVGVDSRFVGTLIGRPEPKLSADSHRESYSVGRNTALRPLPNLCVYKPHGSLDWFDVGGKVVRCPVHLGRAPIIITPGTSKYRESFRWAFDDQRTAGNRAVNNATRLMFIGYGFNDDHLEQHICPSLALNKPTIILAKDLSANAKRLIENSTNTQVIALSAVSQTDLRTRITTSAGGEIVADEQLWHLGGFNQGVI